MQTGEVRISTGLEAALAPALLPRTWLTQRVLLALKQVHLYTVLPPCCHPYTRAPGCHLYRGAAHC